MTKLVLPKEVPYTRVISKEDFAKRVKGDIVHRESSAEDGTITVRFSNFTRDDYGTRFDPAGCDLSQYRRNPMVTYCHGMDSGIYSLPVGRGIVDSFESREDGLYMKLEFTPADVFEFGSLVGRLVRSGFLNMVSIGADPQREEIVTEANGQQTLVFREWKLFDISIVPMGSNDDALITKRAKQFSLGVGSLRGVEKELRESVQNLSEEDISKTGESLGLQAEAPKEEPKEVAGIEEGTKVEAESLPSGDVEVNVTVPAPDGSEVRMRHVVKVKESADQIRNREYFDKWHKTGKQYRSLLEKLYARIGEIAPSDEKVAVERMISKILPPEQRETSHAHTQPAATRQLQPQDVQAFASQLGASLPDLMRAALAKVVASGKPLRNREALVAAAVQEVTQNLSISIPSK